MSYFPSGYILYIVAALCGLKFYANKIKKSDVAARINIHVKMSTRRGSGPEYVIRFAGVCFLSLPVRSCTNRDDRKPLFNIPTNPPNLPPVSLFDIEISRALFLTKFSNGAQRARNLYNFPGIDVASFSCAASFFRPFKLNILFMRKCKRADKNKLNSRRITATSAA